MVNKKDQGIYRREWQQSDRLNVESIYCILRTWCFPNNTLVSDWFSMAGVVTLGQIWYFTLGRAERKFCLFRTSIESSNRSYEVFGLGRNSMTIVPLKMPNLERRGGRT